MQTVNNGGDVLARGGVRAQFGPAKVSQEKWDAIWAEEPKEDGIIVTKPASVKSSRKSSQ